MRRARGALFDHSDHLQQFRGERQRAAGKLVSPTAIKLSRTGYDEQKNQFNGKASFRLVDDGKAIADPAAD